MVEKRTKTYIEDKKLRGIRIAIAVMYGIQIFLTSEPFAVRVVDGKTLQYITPFSMIRELFISSSWAEFGACAIFSVLVLLPAISFFFFILDKKTNIKSFVSLLTCVLCVYIISFEIGYNYAFGALVSLLLYLIIMFCSVILMLGTSSYNREYNTLN